MAMIKQTPVEKLADAVQAYVNETTRPGDPPCLVNNWVVAFGYSAYADNNLTHGTGYAIADGPTYNALGLMQVIIARLQHLMAPVNVIVKLKRGD